MHESMCLIKNIDVFAQLWTSGIPTLSCATARLTSAQSKLLSPLDALMMRMKM